MAEVKLTKKALQGSMLAYTDRMRELSQKKAIKNIPSVLTPKLVADDAFQVSFSLGGAKMVTKSEELPQTEEQSLTIEPLYRSEIKTRKQASAKSRRKGSFLPNIHQGHNSTSYQRSHAYNMSDMYSTIKSTGYSIGTSSSQVEIVDILPYPDFSTDSYSSSLTTSKPISSQNKPMVRNRGMHKKNFYARKKRPPTPPKSKSKPNKRPRPKKPTKGKRRGGKNGADDPRKFPIKKQFIWSELMDQELKSHIPPRVPGSKLKPNYRRTSTGDIYIPDGPIEIELERLATLNMDSPTEKQLSGAYAEEIKALMERNAKRRAEAKAARKKAKKKVKFVFPPGYTDSESSSDDDDEYTDIESDPNVSDNTKDVGERSENAEEGGGGANDDGSRQLPNDDITITSVQDSVASTSQNGEGGQSPSSVIVEIVNRESEKKSSPPLPSLPPVSS